MEINYGYTSGNDCLVKYAIIRRSGNSNSLSNLSRGFRTLGVSQSSTKKIRKATTVLNHFSLDKPFTNKCGVPSVCRLSFVTLTLPSAQNHSDQFLTKNALGGFFDLCRKRGIFSNYVWRAEKQKNGNIHYHILTDDLVNELLVYSYWNLQMQKLGYLHAYTEKMSALDFKGYTNLESNRNQPHDRLLYRFNKGKKLGWTRPNDTDVKYLGDVTAVAKYLSKYLSKDSASENIVKGRIWSCSAGISEGVKIFYSSPDFNKMAFDLASDVLKKETIEFDYFKICKCKLTSLKSWFPWLWEEISKLIYEVFTPIPPNFQTHLQFII